MGLDSSVFVHEKAIVESDDIGPRTRIWAFAHVLAGARIGADCNICNYTFIEGDVRIGDGVVLKPGVQLCDRVTVEDDVFMGPSTIFTNDINPRAAFRKDESEWQPTLVRRGATLGANVTVVCGTTLGECAFIGAGGVVARDVPAHALVVGSPARRVGWVCECGERLDDEYACGCGRRYVLVDERAGLAPAT